MRYRASSWTIIPAIILLCVMSESLAHAQTRGKISGVVVEAETGERLPGVNVLIVGTQTGTATDARGEYFIANLEAGTYDVRASMVGFQPIVVQDVTVRSNATTEVDFEMREAVMEGGEVVIVASRPLVQRDNTTSVVRLEATEVASRPTTSFTDVLTTLPGIDNEDGQLTVRGGGLDEVAFVVDGARARNTMNNQPYTRVNLSSIAEVEVITGSYNAEYGEAQSGVINIVTKEGSDSYSFFLDSRYQPPGKKHWGTHFYDKSSRLYWENTNARHLEWWVEYPDMWVDPNGVRGSSPNSSWTPEEAHENYLETHQPITNYTDIPTVQTEVGFGGPVPRLNDMSFFTTLKYRSEPPLLGNASRDRGEFLDGTIKLAYRLNHGRKLTLSAFYGKKEAGWGFQSDQDFSVFSYPFWASTFGINGRYARYDLAGYPFSQTNGQTLRFSNVVNNSTYYEVRLSRVQAVRRQGIIPGDSIGWEASDATRDFLRAVDESGTPIPGGNQNLIGFNTTGYLVQYDDSNVDWQLDGFISSQINQYVSLKTGLDVVYSVLDHYNISKFPDRVDEDVYTPYQGAAYAQSKIEYGGLIMNAGLRLDFYNPNDRVYTDLFDPLVGETESTSVYSQLSPRIGISHPIDARTKLHFSYGHFFQRPNYNDFGEGSASISGSLNTFIVVDDEGNPTDVPWVIGNRKLRPRKTISYEVGLERNFQDLFVLDVTGYYKDIRNTIRTVTIESPNAIYRTNGNGDYADQRGIELSIRKIPSRFSWGAIWGYANYSTRIGILGRSGDPVVITPDGQRFGSSGDVITHTNPRLKAGLFYETPDSWSGPIGSVFKRLSTAVDYVANFPNEDLRQDIFVVDGEKHTRPVESRVDLRLRKEISLTGGLRLSPYVEVSNLLNQKWIFLSTFERASLEDQRELVESDFKNLPTHEANGRPIHDLAKFQNLPRQVVMGMTIEF